MPHHRFKGWAAWPLVLTAAFPAAVSTRLGWWELSGTADHGLTQSPPLSGTGLLGQRWSNLWWSHPTLTTLLLSALLPLLVLAAVLLAQRPSALVPTGAARTAATAVAAFTTALGALGVAGFLAQATGLMPVDVWSGTPSERDAFAPFAAVVLLTAVLGAAATAVLWPRADELDDDERDQEQDHKQDDERDGQRDEQAGEQQVPAERAGTGTGTGTPGEQALPDESGRDASRASLDAAPAPGPPQHRPAAPPDLPAPSSEDLELYRRR